jgi:hypothetical protein
MTQTIRLLLEEKLGRRVRYPKDCDALAVEIKESVGDRISPSTLKRIFGFINPPGSPSLYTLDVISHFLGFLDWEDLQQKMVNNGIDSHMLANDDRFIRSEDIIEGQMLELGYAPERQLVLLCIGKSQFRIIETVNSSLRPNDVLEIFLFGEKFPLYVNSVCRDQKNLGPFIGAKRTGIDYIRVRIVDSGKDAG